MAPRTVTPQQPQRRPSVATDSSHRPRRRGEQPPEWEAVLRKVTVPHDPRQVRFDPVALEQFLDVYSRRYREFLQSGEPGAPDERERQIERLRHIIEHKLTGPGREALLLLLQTGWSYRRIAQHLGVTKDVVNRAVRKSIRLIRDCIRHDTLHRFPRVRGGSFETAILPLDTAEERTAFQQFLVQSDIVQIAYSGHGDLREALVVYQPRRRRRTA